MRIINICANYGGNKDGIGDYSKKMVETILKLDKKIKVENFSSNIQNYGKIHRMFSLKMSGNIKKAYKAIKKEKYDLVNIEYPFTEWNPLILYYYRKLAKSCKKNKVKLCISLHEYERVNKLRKLVIRELVKKADFILATSNETKKHVEKYNTNIYIRDIPSIIPITKPVETNEKNIDTYVYFGLINSSKAFEKMINGWINNHKKISKSELIIITSSEIDLNEEHGIRIKRNLNDSQIEKIMQKATYTILPIKPDINLNNSTLKAATLFGTIPIGVFSDVIKDNNNRFYIDMENYELEEFNRVFDYIEKLEQEELNELQSNAIEFGKKYEIENIAKVIYDIYSKETYNK